jgi:hypothetical protein
MMSQQGNEGKQTQQRWAGAQDGVWRPLTLAFKAQMSADFLKALVSANWLWRKGWK